MSPSAPVSNQRCHSYPHEHSQHLRCSTGLAMGGESGSVTPDCPYGLRDNVLPPGPTRLGTSVAVTVASPRPTTAAASGTYQSGGNRSAKIGARRTRTSIPTSPARLPGRPGVRGAQKRQRIGRVLPGSFQARVPVRATLRLCVRPLPVFGLQLSDPA
jgi:hypothetical protein